MYIVKECIKAKKEQVCQICGGIIEPGTFYHRIGWGKGHMKICQKKHPIKITAEAITDE